MANRAHLAVCQTERQNVNGFQRNEQWTAADLSSSGPPGLAAFCAKLNEGRSSSRERVNGAKAPHRFSRRRVGNLYLGIVRGGNNRGAGVFSGLRMALPAGMRPRPQIFLAGASVPAIAPTADWPALNGFAASKIQRGA